MWTTGAMARREGKSVNSVIPGDKPGSPEKDPVSNAVRNNEAVPQQPDTRQKLIKLTGSQTQENTRTECPQLVEEAQNSERSGHLSLTESAQATESSSVHRLNESEKMKSALKFWKSARLVQQSPVKGGTYDAELIRVLRERDEMKNMLDRHERHTSEILANLRVLRAERDNTRMQYLQAQDEIAELRREVLRSKIDQGSKYSVTAQSMLKRLEIGKDKAKSDLHFMTTERDSLRERLKIAQENAISERAHLEQRVEDLQNAVITLEVKRAEQMSRQAEMKEAMMSLDTQLSMSERKLAATEGELSCIKSKCHMLWNSNTQTENTLSETQKRLVTRIADLQRVEKINKILNDRNDSLMKEVTVLKEQLNKLQKTFSEVNQNRDTLHEQLERKNDLLYSINKEMDDKETSIHNMKLQIEDLEASIQSTKEAVSCRDRDLDETRRTQLDLEDKLDSALRLKDATQRDNTQLRDELDQMHLENKALQLKVDESTVETEALGRKIHKYVSDITSMKHKLFSKEQEMHECQVEQRASDLENSRLKKRVESLESSLQEAVSAKESCSAELTQLKSTLEKQEEALQQAQSKQLNTHQELEKARDLCLRLDTEKEAVQQELQMCNSELEVLREQIKVEREKVLDTQLSSHEKLIEIQILKDKLTVIESKANTQSVKMAQLRTRSTLLEADLEATQRQLSTERENTMMEMYRLGLSSSSPVLSSTLYTPPTPIDDSNSPATSECSPQTTSDDLPQEQSPDRSETFEDISA